MQNAKCKNQNEKAKCKKNLWIVIVTIQFLINLIDLKENV